MTISVNAPIRMEFRAALGRQVGPWRVVLSAGLAWFVMSVIVLHFILASAATVTAFLDVVFQLAALGVLIAASTASLPQGRRLASYAVVALLTSLLASLPGRLSATTDVLALLIAVIAAAAAVRQQRLAAAVQAARPIAEADRMRTALLASVSHDLRTPLAAAVAAVSCLRSGDIQLTDEDHDELLATAEESLDQLTDLLASLLDVSRLQAGAVPVFPRPADLGEIIAHSLDGSTRWARAVTVDLPPDLPQVMADPPIMERVIANLTANALRYSPAGSPPLLTASTRGDRIELRVADRGPGVPLADRDRMFAPFERLGATRDTTGLGLGLTLARGLTEAMRGTLEPEMTPGGGLTMTISLPAAVTPGASS